MNGTTFVSVPLLFASVTISIIMISVGTLLMYIAYRQTRHWQEAQMPNTTRFYLLKFFPITVSGMTILLTSIYLSGGSFPGKIYYFISILL